MLEILMLIVIIIAVALLLMTFGFFLSLLINIIIILILAIKINNDINKRNMLRYYFISAIITIIIIITPWKFFELIIASLRNIHILEITQAIIFISLFAYIIQFFDLRYQSRNKNDENIQVKKIDEPKKATTAKPKKRVSKTSKKESS